ncbi:TIGR03084 family metal-binding protein [Micromonospora sp. SH-82]|uniref:TIGR03084 family metal-binding protein n=2 Tax=unclassified Micromonospora TaxID=2617518 RepID=UPI003EB981A2
MVADLDTEGWRTETPAPGWTVAHQIAHLAATFKLAALAASDAGRFSAVVSRLTPDFSANVDAALAGYLAEEPPELLRRWREERVAAERALSALPGDHMVPWLVRPLPAAVLACAGMMELFAHGQDVADALGIRRRHDDRIGHLVGFAVRTWDFGYLARKIDVPDVQMRFEITAPSGKVWEFGPADADQRVTGPAVDFCLLATRRRHHADLAVAAEGDVARNWLEIAQAYRGPAGPGRQPGQFAAAIPGSRA